MVEDELQGPTNQQLFEMVANLRDQMDKLNRKVETPQPVESPDDWVTQDRVPPRACDEFRWVNPDTGVRHQGQIGEWNQRAHFGRDIKHGHIDGADGTYKLEVRCRRKDLPPLPAEEKPEYPRFYKTKDAFRLGEYLRRDNENSFTFVNVHGFRVEVVDHLVAERQLKNGYIEITQDEAIRLLNKERQRLGLLNDPLWANWPIAASFPSFVTTTITVNSCHES